MQNGHDLGAEYSVCSVIGTFINALSGALQRGAKCTQGKLRAFTDQNLGYVFSLSIQHLQSKHPNVLLAMHNLEVGVSALFATDTTSTDHRESCVALYAGKKRTRKLIGVFHCFESQMLVLFSGAQKVNIQDMPKPQHSAPNPNFPKVQGYEDPSFWFSSEVWPSVSLKFRDVWIKAVSGPSLGSIISAWSKQGTSPSEPRAKIFT